MSDAPPPDQPERVNGGGAGGGLTHGDIDWVLADFRVWLEDLASGPRERAGAERGEDNPSQTGRPPFDLHTFVTQFTALRHEVNLQTKATRAAVEQNARLIEQRPTTDETLRPLVKAVIDIADSLALALRQVEKVRTGVEPLLADLADSLPLERPGLFTRLFAMPTLSGPHAKAVEVADKLRSFLAGVADGYAMSLRRVERVLPQLGLEPIPASGRPFDPDTMEVVEVVAAEPSGVVSEEVRRGYRWNGTVFRFAQVKVAR
jgi:molecular chaperone GrpE